MPKSTLTVKYQTTVPKEVTAAAPAFLALQGRFKVGPGDPVEDARKARESMGVKGL